MVRGGLPEVLFQGETGILKNINIQHINAIIRLYFDMLPIAKDVRSNKALDMAYEKLERAVDLKENENIQ